MGPDADAAAQLARTRANVAAAPVANMQTQSRLHRLAAPFIISRNSRVKYAIETAVFAAFVLTILLVPLQLAFRFSAVYFYRFDQLADAIFALNIIISFLTATNVEGVEVFEPSTCFSAYFNSHFYRDLFAAAPWPYMADLFGADFFIPMRLIWVLRLTRLFTMQHSQLLTARSTALKLTKLVLSVFSMAHWLGCMWLAISEYEGFPGTMRSLSTENARWGVHMCIRVSSIYSYFSLLLFFVLDRSPVCISPHQTMASRLALSARVRARGSSTHEHFTGECCP